MAKAKRKEKAAPAEDVLSAEELAAAAAAAEAVENVEEVDVEAAVAAVEAEEAKKETYAKSGTKDKTSAKATPSEPKKEARPRMSLETHKASEIIVSRLGAASHEQFNLVAGATPKPDALKKAQSTVLGVIDTLDKKTREKAVNLFVALNDGKAPSVYTVSAIRFLQSQGSMTLKTLTDHFLASGYKIGTARRQAGEMIALLPVVGVGSREATRGAPVVFNKDSEIARRVLAAAAPSTK